MDIVRFENPYLLWLLILIPGIVAFYIYKLRAGRPTLTVSTVSGIKHLPRTTRYYFRHVPFALFALAFASLIVAIARPQSSHDDSTVQTDGVDIVMALDISTSMLARDFSPDRLTAAKNVAEKFINDRRGDRLGLVIFAGESFTQVPVTSDYTTLVNMLRQVEPLLVHDGTAIGNGLATAISRLKESSAKSKVVILLTDGVNNAGEVAPQLAAEAAEALGIKVYTIGVGANGVAPTPAIDEWGHITYVNAPVNIDEDILRNIASTTGGKYYRATDNNSLTNIYSQINSMEKTKIDVQNFVLYDDSYEIFVLAAIVLLTLSLAIKKLYLRQLP